MQNLSSGDQDYNLWVLLGQAAQAAFKARERELNQYGISAMQAAALFVIQAIGDQATPAKISRWLFRESHTISGLLDRMEREGLVKRVKDLDRKNLVRVVMTEKGQQAYRESTKGQSIHKLMSSLSEKERQELRSCLERLRNKALEDLAVDRKPPPFPLF